MLVFDKVTLRYPYDEFDVLKCASFTICEGVNTVLADAQSGKSTICKLLMKDIAPTCGQIFVDGVEISCITNSNLDILYLPRNPVFFERKSVQYNMEYPLKIRKVAKTERLERVREIAHRFGIDLGVKPCKLSREQRLTLAVARGLTVKRKIALLDSFFDGDTPSFEQINSIAQHFDTCVIFTSDPALAMGNTVVLDGGEVVFEGDAAEAQERISKLYWLSRE